MGVVLSQLPNNWLQMSTTDRRIDNSRQLGSKWSQAFLAVKHAF
jgi:hypothetical protein